MKSKEVADGPNRRTLGGMDKQDLANRFLEVLQKVKVRKQQARQERAEDEAIRKMDAREEAIREGFDRG